VNSGAVDLNGLSIIKGKKCWIVHIDLFVRTVVTHDFDFCIAETYYLCLYLFLCNYRSSNQMVTR
jgi:exosome complex RNA-binding protein Rrp42 (RNase PH superfamily)